MEMRNDFMLNHRSDPYVAGDPGRPETLPVSLPSSSAEKSAPHLAMHILQRHLWANAGRLGDFQSVHIKTTFSPPEFEAAYAGHLAD